MQLPSLLSLGLVVAAVLTPAARAVTPPLARSPERLAALLARYDRATPAEQRALEPELDAVAGQRYAAAARLFWYTDLGDAQRAARASHRPILALRMLGDLREDLSCANSRLFRATLYANTAVAALLRDHFVLYWSSERDVPKVTIDFGDGRKIVRTVTGNSAHYVLDGDGQVLDVLPGLYAPEVFRAELGKSLAFAHRIESMPAAQRRAALVTYHAQAQAEAQIKWTPAQDVRYIAHRRSLLAPDDLSRAQRATMSKAAVEVPDLRTIGLIQPDDLALDDVAAWSAVGQKLWNIAPAAASPSAPFQPSDYPVSVVLDAPSRALVTRLHTAGPDAAATPEQLDAMVARLEQHIIADTAINQLRLRPQIHGYLAQAAATDFASVNAWIYDRVFATPRTDPWLGLRARTEFSGLPGDGVVVP